MIPCTLYYATNRHHEGDDAHPTRYGPNFSEDGHENLRFGYVTVRADAAGIGKFLRAKVNGLGRGDGNGLAGYFKDLASAATIETYTENLLKNVPDTKQDPSSFGSTGFFRDLQDDMKEASDVLVYVHGFNVNWEEAVGSALALQEMVNAQKGLRQRVIVVLFTWPSEGKAIPYYSYLLDRADARGSGFAVGRGFLKLRDFFVKLTKDQQCGQSIHVLCHSMGNYILQNAVERMEQFVTTPALPQLFENIFMCAADVDDNVLEPGRPLGRLNELSRSISVYYNRQDKAMEASQLTKGNPERLGYNGCARPYHVHSKVNEIDCTPVVPGGLFAAEHSYYMLGDICRDIVQSISGLAQDARERQREVNSELPNTWRMK